MIKRIIFVLILCCALISCGKKGDPIYKESKKIIQCTILKLNEVYKKQSKNRTS